MRARDDTPPVVRLNTIPVPKMPSLACTAPDRTVNAVAAARENLVILFMILGDLI
jgi:hypothetical protein